MANWMTTEARDLSQSSDPEDLIGWGAKLARFRDDPELMATLFEQLGPRETARLLRLTGFAADRSHSYPGEMEATLGWFKGALASASTRLADAKAFARELARWLLPKELSDDEYADALTSGGLPDAGPAVLAQMLRGTSFDPDFLTGLAERVEHFERSGKVDPAAYYRVTTPARYDDFQPRHIPSLIFEQLSRHPETQRRATG